MRNLMISGALDGLDAHSTSVVSAVLGALPPGTVGVTGTVVWTPVEDTAKFEFDW